MKHGDGHSSRGQSREASAVGKGGAWWAEGGGHPAVRVFLATGLPLGTLGRGTGVHRVMGMSQ